MLRRHHDQIHAICRRLAGNDADGQDATQEALIAIVRGLPRFHGKAKFSTWAYRVATNAALDELRRRSRRPIPTLAEADAGSTGSAMADEPAEEESYAAPAEADAAFDDAMAAEMMAEEPAAMAEEEPMAEAAPATTTLVVSSDAEEMAAAEMAAEETAAAEMAAAETADDTRRDEEQQTATTPSSDGEPGKVAVLAVDLGTFDDIESLINGVAAHWSAGDPVDATLAERGACAAELDDRVAEMNAEAFQSFVAVIVTDEFAVTGAVLARHDDDSAFLAFGTEPDCKIGTQALEVPPEP